MPATTEAHGSPSRDAAVALKSIGNGDAGKAGYKSWKKKYRKMRITFDSKMHDSEELHRQEEKASAIVKRLAIENDRLLDTLTEVNRLSQIPNDKRIDVSSPTSADPSLTSLSTLEKDVSHLTYAAAKDANPDLVADLTILETDPSQPGGAGSGGPFLTPDDLDDYIYAIDNALFDTAREVPSLAPKANPAAHPPPNPHLKNPTSVTNWLRKHAPKVFLQDGEDSHATGAADDEQHPPAKKGRGKAADRGATGTPSAASKSKLKRSIKAGSGDEDGGDTSGPRGSTPVGRGAGKRKRDDDPGYRPKSGTRPTKKKRKSEGAESGTGSGRKAKKETATEGTPGAGED
ncbi:IEC3 subunit of the ino80 complex, chromatin re-modelling domain-containing protein [Sarocladium implicatum]|nr:IEC3 subunit of the ino80 complex, chromatin re-modelling domain-containing protein [Sarocladium implicatum]